MTNISLAANADEERMLDSGKASSVIQSLEKKIASQSGIERYKAIHSLADICLITDDESCLDKVYMNYGKDLNDYVQTAQKQNPDQFPAIFDASSAYLYFWILGSMEESQYDQALRYESQQYQGSAYSYHGGLRLVGKAMIAAVKGDKSYADEQMKRARALILSKNPGKLMSQSNLAFLLEASLFYLHDAKEIRRWYQAEKVASNKQGKAIFAHYNLYVRARLLHVVYNAGFLSDSEEIQLIEELHKTYSSLDINPDSRLHRKMEEFYAYLALEAFLNKEKLRRKLSFDPRKRLNEISINSAESMGIKTYLDLESGLYSINAISERLKDMDVSEKKGVSTKMTMAPLKAILNSLVARYQKNEQLETDYLEHFIDKQRAFFKKQGFRVGDNNPVLSKSGLLVHRYVLERLKTLKPDSPHIVTLGLLTIQSLNSSLHGEEQASYTILNSAKNDLEEQQALDFLTLKERYSTFINHVYLNNALRLSQNQTKKVTEKKSVYPEEAHIGLLGLFTQNRAQLTDLRARKNTGFILELADIQQPLQPGEVALLTAKLNDHLLAILVVNDSNSHFSLVDMSAPDIASAVSLLQSRELAKIPAEKIKNASLTVSKAIQSGLNLNAASHKVYLLTGQSIFNIPYTLFSNPHTQHWLIQDISIVSFNSSSQFLNREPTSKKWKSAYSFVGFANPKLREKSELQAIAETESLIRGVSKDKVSSLPELPETELEINSIAKHLSGNKKIHVREKANIENLLQINLDDVEVLSFATHGVMAGEMAGVLSPAIVLTPSSDDGLVSSEILFSMQGAPRVVLLSTCNSRTTSATLDLSEIDSLSGAFFLKGTKVVIASYWAVNSDGTTALMSELGNALSQGYSYNEALAKAQNTLITSTNWSHPSVWAAFVSAGEYKNNHAVTARQERVFRDATIESAIEDGHSILIAMAKPNEPVSTIDIVNKSSLEKTGLIPLPVADARSVKLVKDRDGLVYAGVKYKDKFVTYAVDGQSASAKKICEFDLDSAWTTDSFFVKDKYVNAYFYRGAREKGEYGLLSVDLNNCAVSSLPLLNADFRGVSKTTIIPGKSQGDVILLAQSLPEKKHSNDKLNELNMLQKCPIHSQIQYEVLDKNWKTKKSGSELNIDLTNSSMDQDGWVYATQSSECGNRNFARKINVAQFEQPYLLGANDYKAISRRDSIPIGLSDEELKVSNNFAHIIGWYGKTGADLMYVVGSTNLTSVLFPSTLKATLPDTVKARMLIAGFGIYVYKKSNQSWYRMGSMAECNLATPLVYDGNEALVGCMNGENAANRSSIMSLNTGVIVSEKR